MPSLTKILTLSSNNYNNPILSNGKKIWLDITDADYEGSWESNGDMISIQWNNFKPEEIDGMFQSDVSICKKTVNKPYHGSKANEDRVIFPSFND